MLSKIDCADKDVLVMFNIEFLLELNLEKVKSITFVTGCNLREKIAKNLLNKYNGTVKKISVLSDLESLDMKFDVVIGNPPFDGTLHLDFLEKAYLWSSQYVLWVSPDSWLKEQRPAHIHPIKSIVGNGWVSFEIIDPKDCFGVRVGGSDCVISLIDKQKTTPEVLVYSRIQNKSVQYSNINKVNSMLADGDLFDSIKNKIWNYCTSKDNMANHLNVAVGNNYINFSDIGGTGQKYYEFLSGESGKVSSEPVISKNGNEMIWVSFSTRKEANNSYDYINISMIAKFAFMIVKINVHRKTFLKYIPWFDFSEKWDDVKIAKELGLTDEEVKFIMEETK